MSFAVIQVLGIERKRWRESEEACAFCEQPILRRSPAAVIRSTGHDDDADESVHAVHADCALRLIERWQESGASVIGEDVVKLEESS